jgi:hypothetical protein
MFNNSCWKRTANKKLELAIPEGIGIKLWYGQVGSCIATKDYLIENKHNEANKRTAVSVFSKRITLKLEEAVTI